MSTKAEQAERKALAGSTSATTYFHQAQIGRALDEPGGRFRAKDTIVTGNEPSVDYPAGPDWTSNGAGVGLEPPLGIDVDALEPTGTPSEVAASLAGAEAPSAVSPPATVETAPANSITRRRKL